MEPSNKRESKAVLLSMNMLGGRGVGGEEKECWIFSVLERDAVDKVSMF